MRFPVPNYVFTASCLLSAFAFALPAEQIAEEALARLQGRATCNTDNCLRFFQHADPIAASAYCESYIASTPGTITITASAAATSTPDIPLTTLSTGTTTVTMNVDCTVTVLSTNLYKRAAATTPLPTLASKSCTSNAVGEVTARITSACKCLLTSATTTVTSTSTLVLPTPDTQTITTSFASTETNTICTSVSTVTVAVNEPATCSTLPSPFTSYGRSFTTMCNYGYGYNIYTDFITNVFGVSNFKQCLDICATTRGCKYFTHQRAPYNYCTLLQSVLQGDTITTGDSGFAN